MRPTSKGNRGIVGSKIDIKNQSGEVVISYEATRMLAGESVKEPVMRGLKGKTVLVTGGANGIGAAIARRLADEGCVVGILDLDAASGEKVVGRDQECQAAKASVPPTLPTTTRSSARWKGSRRRRAGGVPGQQRRLGPRGELPR